jgi:hypothetical protein
MCGQKAWDSKHRWTTGEWVDEKDETFNPYRRRPARSTDKKAEVESLSDGIVEPPQWQEKRLPRVLHSPDALGHGLVD